MTKRKPKTPKKRTVGFTITLTGNLDVGDAANDWEACRRVEGMDLSDLESHITGMQVEAEVW